MNNLGKNRKNELNNFIKLKILFANTRFLAGKLIHVLLYFCGLGFQIV